MKKEANQSPELPVGFGMALSMRPDAMLAFSKMPSEKRQALISQASQVESKPEMEALVEKLTDNKSEAEPLRFQ